MREKRRLSISSLFKTQPTYFQEVGPLLRYVNVECRLLALAGHHDEPAEGELAPGGLHTRATRLKVHQGVVEAHVLLIKSGGYHCVVEYAIS